jgi:hypothetical protein
MATGTVLCSAPSGATGSFSLTIEGYYRARGHWRPTSSDCMSHSIETVAGCRRGGPAASLPSLRRHRDHERTPQSIRAGARRAGKTNPHNPDSGCGSALPLIALRVCRSC